MRVYLEDGRYAVTDDEGKYHFEGVTPGSHVVQLDTVTLPESSAAALRHARAQRRPRYSQFVDLRGGALGAADFVVAQRAAPTGDARLTLETAQTADGFVHTATVTVAQLPIHASARCCAAARRPRVRAGQRRARRCARGGSCDAQNGSLRFALGEVAADTRADA